MTCKEYHYQVPWLARSSYPGRHRSSQAGSGMLTRRSVPLQGGADLRKLDLRARIADPMQRWWVRETAQRDAIPVWLIADVSSSMSYAAQAGASDKLSLLRDFATATAQSALRSGDAFGMVAADDTLRDDLRIPLTRRAGVRDAVQATLQDATLTRARTRASALPQCALQLSARKGLVFLVSDFLFDLATLKQVLTSLAHHHVVPVMVQGAEVLSDMPHYGWVMFNDLETGVRRSLLLRPALVARLKQAAAAHEAALMHGFNELSMRPLKLSAPFDADAVTDYFYQA